VVLSVCLVFPVPVVLLVSVIILENPNHFTILTNGSISVYDSVGTAVLNLILCQKSCIGCIFRDNVTSKRHLRIIMCNSGSVEVSLAAVAVHGKYTSFGWI